MWDGDGNRTCNSTVPDPTLIELGVFGNVRGRRLVVFDRDGRTAILIGDLACVPVVSHRHPASASVPELGFQPAVLVGVADDGSTLCKHLKKLVFVVAP